MKPKISVVMTVYNGERYLDKAILSVLHQTFDDFEFIIVNDGSTDRTEKIIKSYKDKRIVYIKKEKNETHYKLHEVINMGLKIAKGDYVARLDADDFCLSNRLQVQYDYLEKNKDIFMIGSSAEVISEFGEVTGKITKISYPSFLYKLRVAFSNSFVHSSIMFRNEAYMYNSHIEHFFYFSMLINNKKIKNISDTLVQYRINPYGIIAKTGARR